MYVVPHHTSTDDRENWALQLVSLVGDNDNQPPPKRFRRNPPDVPDYDLHYQAAFAKSFVELSLSDFSNLSPSQFVEKLNSGLAPRFDSFFLNALENVKPEAGIVAKVGSRMIGQLSLTLQPFTKLITNDPKFFFVLGIPAVDITSSAGKSSLTNNSSAVKTFVTKSDLKITSKFLALYTPPTNVCPDELKVILQNLRPP